MDKLHVTGGIALRGEIAVAGAKNVALKAFVASLLTSETLTIHNIPEIADVQLMLELVKSLGVDVKRSAHAVTLSARDVREAEVPLDVGARLRTSSLVLGPMLARFGEAIIPNPGGCRIGARPIDRHVTALREMGAEVTYHSDDGFFHAKAKRLHGTTITFPKNTHTGTEALILAAVLADGTTVLKNAAEEVEVDDLISLLTSMGAKINRTADREITIHGVASLHGTEFSIMPDRNEEVTFAIAAAITGGSLTVHGSQTKYLGAFLEKFKEAGGGVDEIRTTTTRYTAGSHIISTDVTTAPHPAFMTDWQAPWAVFMTQAKGISSIHETIFESRFSYVTQLAKMGADISYYDPPITNPESYYNFNWTDKGNESHQAIRISGPTKLHNAVVSMNDLRAGATILLAALVAEGESVIHGVEQIDRGYERIEERLAQVGAHVTRLKEEVV